MPIFAVRLVFRDAQALNDTTYSWPFCTIISRWRNWASQRFAPPAFTLTHIAPFLTIASPSAGLEKLVNQGKIEPDEKSELRSRLCAGSPGASDLSETAGPPTR